jgi:hypothetical protein
MPQHAISQSGEWKSAPLGTQNDWQAMRLPYNFIPQ